MDLDVSDSWFILCFCVYPDYYYIHFSDLVKDGLTVEDVKGAIQITPAEDIV